MKKVLSYLFILSILIPVLPMYGEPGSSGSSKLPVILGGVGAACGVTAAGLAIAARRIKENPKRHAYQHIANSAKSSSVFSRWWHRLGFMFTQMVFNRSTLRNVIDEDFEICDVAPDGRTYPWIPDCESYTQIPLIHCRTSANFVPDRRTLADCLVIDSNLSDPQTREALQFLDSLGFQFLPSQNSNNEQEEKLTRCQRVINAQTARKSETYRFLRAHPHCPTQYVHWRDSESLDSTAPRRVVTEEWPRV